MSDFILGIGMLLVIFGPLLLIPLTWALYRFVFRRWFASRWTALAVAAGFVAAALALSYLPGKRAFDDHCQDHGPPQVAQQVRVEGFYRDELFAYEAANYVTQDGFRFVEAPDPYEEGVLLRYTMGANGQVRQEEIAELSSVYGVRKSFSELDHGISLTEKTVYEIATRRQLANAVESVYHGGPLSLLLGSAGSASCPDIRNPKGSREFRIFYDLEKIVLQSQPLP